MSNQRRCTATKKNSQPCRAWAIRGSDPPRCRHHATSKEVQPDVPASQIKEEPARQGNLEKPPERDVYAFYGRTFTLEEMMALINLALDHSLNGEVAAARVAVRRILQQLGEQLTPAEYARLASLVFTGTQTIAQLLKARNTLSEETAEKISSWMGDALNEIGNVKGVKL
jgi:hypothetical protein